MNDEYFFFFLYLAEKLFTEMKHFIYRRTTGKALTCYQKIKLKKKYLRAIEHITLNQHKSMNIQWPPTVFQLKYLILNQTNTIYFIKKEESNEMEQISQFLFGLD